MQRLTVLLSLSLVMAACAEQFVPVAPSGPVTPFVLSGTVYEHVALRARASGFVQPCSATAVVTGDTTLDVHIVRETVLLTSGIPASMPITEPQISGRVFERTASGDRTIADARVHSAFKVGRWDWLDVVTATDGSGRYVLCGVTDKTAIYAETSGYISKDATVDLNRTTTYDLQLFPGEF